MSHFVVLVIGDNVEEQLAPYDENIEVDPYWEDEAFQPSDNWYFRDRVEKGILPADMSMEDFCAWLNKKEYEENPDYPTRYRVDHGVLQRQTTYNPKSEWDWYSYGGRWKGMLRTFDGQQVDEGQILEIDWDGMELEAARRAEETIDKVMVIMQNQKRPKTWAEVRDAYPDDIEKAREKYRAQPIVKALMAHEDLRIFMDDAVTYYCLDQDDPKAAFIERAIDSTPSAYAVVKDGEWYSKGKMGWWGMSNDTVEDSVWSKEVKRLIRENPGERITVIDCHI